MLRSGKGEITCPQEVADEFGRFFSKIIGVTSEGQKQSHLRNDPGLNGGCKVQFKFKEVEEGDVLKVLKTLDLNKACGADDIGSKLLWMVAPGICQSLITSLFNSNLRSGQVPEEWKAANITPVPKKGNNDDVSNFRPVSVLPVVGKVFERVVHNQLYSCALASAMTWLRPCFTDTCRSTRCLTQRSLVLGLAIQRRMHSLVRMVEEWRVALNEDRLVGSVSLDLSKAFDMVDHSRKLAKYGVVGRELEWFVGYLSGRKQRVCVRDAKSKRIEVQRGVPQGSIWDPYSSLCL